MMRVHVVDPGNIDRAPIEEAAAIIRAGGLVAFPTETVYGLGADATNADAVERIFSAKGRPSYNPLIVHVADVAGARGCVTEWPAVADALAARFWPGPLTLVLPKAAMIPDNVTAGLGTVGVRMPAHPVALALLRAAGVPIAAPSANQSMAVSPTEATHVAISLGERIDLLLDAGPASVGLESTVLDLTSRVPTILRPGVIGRLELASVVGTVDVVNDHDAGTRARPSPGMLDRHYSPNARVVLSDGVGPDAIARAVARHAQPSDRVAILATSECAPAVGVVIRMPTAPADYARQLYATLHRVDAQGITLLIVEEAPADDAWAAVRDRLARAAR